MFKDIDVVVYYDKQFLITYIHHEKLSLPSAVEGQIRRLQCVDGCGDEAGGEHAQSCGRYSPACRAETNPYSPRYNWLYTVKDFDDLAPGAETGGDKVGLWCDYRVLGNGV
ncbi:hypothetical protein LTR17_014121, partial [Elasticomyces elasticus]